MLDRIEAARAGSGSGLIAELGAMPGEVRTWELIADLTAVFVIGVEAASGLIGNGALALLRHPEQLDELRRRPALIESGIEELIRFDGPVHLTARVATEDLAIAGTPIPAGGQAVIVLAAANRDPAHFNDADRLDLSRIENDHLGFGAGTHGCFAASIARVLGSAAITALATELPGLALSGDPDWLNSVTLRGLSRLPVTYDR
jgi:cytochrome P450